MNDRLRAIDTLQQAREVLIHRLTERILDAREEILDDAAGHSYASEIENLHDQISVRLSHVNGMLSNLPPADEKLLPAMQSSSIDTSAAPSEAVTFGPRDAGINSMVAPARTVSQATTADETTILQLFLHQVMIQNVEAAARSLGQLLGLNEERALSCAEVFCGRVAADPGLLIKAMGLRAEAQSCTPNGGLLLLWECFELKGPESVAAIQTLKARLGRN